MPGRKGLLAPQNTFLDTIATRFDGTRKIFWINWQKQEIVNVSKKYLRSIKDVHEFSKSVYIKVSTNMKGRSFDFSQSWKKISRPFFAYKTVTFFCRQQFRPWQCAGASQLPYRLLFRRFLRADRLSTGADYAKRLRLQIPIRTGYGWSRKRGHCRLAFWQNRTQAGDSTVQKRR